MRFLEYAPRCLQDRNQRRFLGRLIRTVCAAIALAGLMDARAMAADQALFAINRFHIQGNTQLPSEQLQALVMPYTGQTRTLDDVFATIKVIENAYRAAGFPGVKVTVPEQRLVAGVVNLLVVENRIKKGQPPQFSQTPEKAGATQENRTAGQTMGGRFQISGFIVEGNKLLTPEQVAKVVSPFIGSNRVYGDIQLASEAIENAYRAVGFDAVKVHVPGQELVQGQVKLQVNEGAASKSQVTGKPQNSPGNLHDGSTPLQDTVLPNARPTTNSGPLAGDKPSVEVPLAISHENRTIEEKPSLVEKDSRQAASAAATIQTPATAAKNNGPEDPVPFEAVRPGPSAMAANAAKPQSENLPDLTTVFGSVIPGWDIPPVRWGGNTISNYNLNKSPEGGKSIGENQTLNLRASSYIYQPWYAQVSGDVGLLAGSSKQGGGISGRSSSSRNTGMTYGGNLSLFPQSRYPFQAFVQMSDSRASANAQSQQYNSLRMGASQSYRPEEGPENYSANVDRSIVTASNLLSVVDALQGTYGTTIGNHGLNASARYSRNLGDVGGQGSNMFALSGAHSWHADEELNVATSASYTSNQISMLSGNRLSLNNSQVMQAGSSVTWLPDEDLPLTLVGGGNFLQMHTETEITQANLTFVNGYANANYRFSKNLMATAGLTMAHSQNDEIRQFLFGQNASLSYSGTPLIFGDYSYNWGTGGVISNQLATRGANHSLSGNVQHSLMRDIVLSEFSSIALNASQSFSLSNSSESAQSGILTHSGGAYWRLGVGESSLGMLSTTISDSKSIGNFPSHFRSLTAQGNFQTQLSGRSALSANLNFVLTQQLAIPLIPQTAVAPAIIPPTLPNPTAANGSKTASGSGQVTYSHRSPFDIYNLFYAATLQVNTSQTNLRLVSGDPNALAWQTGTVLQQSVDYRIGRLAFRATNSFATLNGKKNASIYFSISREIGDF